MFYSKQKSLFVGFCMLLLLSGCAQPRGNEIYKVTSSDGVVSLNLTGVPLPKGISPKDIRIEPLVANSEEGLQAGYAYDLLPEGLVFEQPVLLTLSLPASDEATIPFVMHSTPTSTEVIDNATITQDMDDNSLLLELPISHFSKIRTTNHGFKAVTRGGGAYPVGGSVPLKITIQPTGSDVGIWDNDKKKYAGADIKKETTYSISSISFLQGGFGEQPLRIDVPRIPGKENLSLDEGGVFYNSFFCESAGVGTVITNVTLDYTLEYYPDWGYANVNPSKQEGAGRTSFSLKNTYTCSEGLMVRVRPYLFICPNGGPSRSGSYLTDATTGEPITNAAGQELDSVTGQPIPPCP